MLEQVEAFAAVLTGMDAASTASAVDFKGKYEPVWAEMLALGVRTAENPYSQLTPDNMATAQAALAAELAARQNRFAVELAKQRADDKACRDLASAVDPFVKAIGSNKASVAESKLDLQGLLELINKVENNPESDKYFYSY